MTSVRLRPIEEVLSPLEQRVLEAVQRDAAVPPKPYEEMTLEEGLAWVRTLEPRHLDPGVARIRCAALNLILWMMRSQGLTAERLEPLLEEVGTHEGRCSLVSRYRNEVRRLRLL